MRTNGQKVCYKVYDLLNKLYTISGVRYIPFVHSLLKYNIELLIELLSKLERITLPSDDHWTTRLAILLGGIEREMITVSKILIKPGMNVLDIGAHVGYHTRLFSDLVGSEGKVYAFEPHPENYRLLIQNCKLLRYQNVVPVQKAVSDKLGYIEFFEMAHSAHHSLFNISEYLSHTTFKKRIFVEITTVDTFLAEQGNPEINFIKMDIEGAEPLALAGMSETIARSKKLAMITEFNPGALEACGMKPLAYLQQLLESGFKVHLIEQNGKLTPIEQLVYPVGPFYWSVNLLCLKNTIE